MEKLAVVGTGVAGLGCSHFLHRHFDLTLFEQNAYIGGHTHTVDVPEHNRNVSMDTGFMVYNEVTYPNLTRFFKELNVTTQPTDMSFSVRHDPSGIEFCGSSLNQLFAQRKNLLNGRYIKMLLQINRFNSEAVAALQDPRFAEVSLDRYIAEKEYGRDFFDWYLAPMACAVWSAPKEKIGEFPAVMLLRFFHNHGFLGMSTQHPWRTVKNGSRSYVDLAVRPFKDRIRLNSPVAKIEREKNNVRVTASNGKTETFDRVILACHADEALRLLADPTDLERKLLGAFSYQTNRATVHSDEKVMPQTRRAWASWNYRISPAVGGGIAYSTHYWMNRLQGVSDQKNYFVTINDNGAVDPAKTHKTMIYEHPQYTVESMRAQKELPALNALNKTQTTYYCGSYFRYGFHEDAFTSALDLCQTITGGPLWARN